MDARTLEFALRKQRVQFASERLRNEFISHLTGVSPVLTIADRLCDGLLWLRKHPQVFIAVGMALIVSRRKRALGWARRAFIVWRLWRKLRGPESTGSPMRLGQHLTNHK